MDLRSEWSDWQGWLPACPACGDDITDTDDDVFAGGVSQIECAACGEMVEVQASIRYRVREVEE
jgi:hypothetical protein